MTGVHVVYCATRGQEVRHMYRVIQLIVMWSHLTQVRELDIFKITVSQTVHGRDAF